MMAIRELILLCTLVGVVMVIIGVIGSAGILILSIFGLCIVLRLWAAFKLRKGSKAARITILIFSIIDLVSFPIGTAVGIYAFWVLLFREGAEEYYNALAESNYKTASISARDNAQ